MEALEEAGTGQREKDRGAEEEGLCGAPPRAGEEPFQRPPSPTPPTSPVAAPDSAPLLLRPAPDAPPPSPCSASPPPRLPLPSCLPAFVSLLTPRLLPPPTPAPPSWLCTQRPASSSLLLFTPLPSLHASPLREARSVTTQANARFWTPRPASRLSLPPDSLLSLLQLGLKQL